MSSRIIIDGVTVVTMNDNDDVHFDGSIVIEGDRIVASGDSQASSEYDRSGATVIDGSGMDALPGLVDLHYHTAIGRPCQVTVSHSSLVRPQLMICTVSCHP